MVLWCLDPYFLDDVLMVMLIGDQAPKKKAERELYKEKWKPNPKTE